VRAGPPARAARLLSGGALRYLRSAAAPRARTARMGALAMPTVASTDGTKLYY